MGNASSYGLKKNPEKKDILILFLGLFDAGKTTSLYNLKLGEVVTTFPSVDFNVETLSYKNVNFMSWDVGGRDKIRPFYRHYFQRTDGLIYMFDSNDRERFETAIKELQQLLSETELDGIPIAIMANKQDFPGALKAEEINRELISRKSLRERVWCLFAVSASSGDGLYEALDWLSSTIAHNQSKKKTVNFGHEKEAKYVDGDAKKGNLSTLLPFKNMVNNLHKLFNQ